MAWAAYRSSSAANTMSEDAEEKKRIRLRKKLERKDERYTDVYQGKLLKTCMLIQGVHDVLHAL